MNDKDIEMENWKLRWGYKEMPIWVYFQGIFALMFPVILILGLLARYKIIPIWLAVVITIPYSAFLGWKGYKAYVRDKVKRVNKNGI